MNRFGQSCLLARRLVERGVRFVTVNTFITVFGEITWDIHGSKPFTSIEGMRDIVAPMYDQGYSALIEDLFQRGMLDDTMVTCLAEFGRTPKINPAGGRDHWPNCWTVNFAGGGVKGGHVVGKKRRHRWISHRTPCRTEGDRCHHLPGSRCGPAHRTAWTAGQAVSRRGLRHAGDQGAVCLAKKASAISALAS